MWMASNLRSLCAVLATLALMVGCGPGEDTPDGGRGDGGVDGGPASDGGVDGGPASDAGVDGGQAPAAAALRHFGASALGPTSVSLSWEAGEGAVVGFQLERSLALEGPFSLLVSPGAQSSGHVDSELTPDTTYWYRARALAEGGPSPWSAVVSVTPTQAASVAPAAPGALAVNPLSDQSLTLSWTLADPDASVEVERASMVSGPFVRVHTTAAGALQFQDTGLSPSTAYWYRVRAVRAGLVSDHSAAAWASTQQVGSPAAPTGLAAVQESANNQSTVRLTWTDGAGETGYQLQHSIDGTNWGTLIELPEGSASWVHLTPAFGNNQYRVRAVNAGGASAWAEVGLYAGPILAGYLCFPPTAASATATSETTVRINWTYAEAASCRRVAVERATSADGPFVEVARQDFFWVWPPIPLDTGLFEDTGRTPGTEYFYRLRSIGTSPEWSSSGYAATVSAQTPNSLGPPTGLSVNVVSSSAAEFSWVDPATDETGFAVELATAAAGPFSEVFRVGANLTLSHAQGFSPGTQYWVRVRTVKGSTVSPPSTAVAFTTASVLVLRATADATVYKSTSSNAAQGENFSDEANAVGCMFTWFLDLNYQTYLFHHCGASLLRFDTSGFAGRTVLGASLKLTPGQLGTGPMNDAFYAVFALASAWNPTTVTYNNLPARHPDGWAVAAPTTSAPSVFNVTAIAQKWAQGQWAQHGLYVQQYPITDRLPPNNKDHQLQTTYYCSLEQSCGSNDYLPTLIVEYR